MVLERLDVLDATGCWLTHPVIKDEDKLLLPDVVVSEGLELLSSWDEPTDKSLMSEDREITELRMLRDRDDDWSPSELSKLLPFSTAHPATPPSCKEIILMPMVLPVLAGMKSVVQPFSRVMAVR